MSIVACLLASASLQATAYQLPADDRTRLAEARRVRQAIEARAWPGWETAPSALLLVTDSVEFLFWHPRPSADFRALGFDSLLGTQVLTRPRQFPPNLLATFPAVGGVPTIVIGRAAATGKTSTDWVVTILHEHFHQLQFSHADYYAAVDTLGLARGDQSGMWMLNFPFPYDSVPIQGLAKSLATAVLERPADVVPRYDALRAALSKDDRRYLDFQLWQEGVARYVEYECARLAAGAGAPRAEFAVLPDYAPYDSVAARLLTGIRGGLRGFDLKANRRTSVYALGAGLALLIDRASPGWKQRYLAPLFTLEPHVRALRRGVD
jgi:hypothetical protein